MKITAISKKCFETNIRKNSLFFVRFRKIRSTKLNFSQNDYIEYQNISKNLRICLTFSQKKSKCQKSWRLRMKNKWTMKYFDFFEKKANFSIFVKKIFKFLNLITIFTKKLKKHLLIYWFEFDNDRCQILWIRWFYEIENFVFFLKLLTFWFFFLILNLRIFNFVFSVI